MLNGTEFTGFKLVEGRKSRCYNVTDDEVAKILLQKGYTENVIYKKTLRSVADMKKVLGADFDNILSEFVLIKVVLLPLHALRTNALYTTVRSMILNMLILLILKINYI